MIERTVCGKCGAEIEKDRLAILDTPLCAKCATETPGNILQDQRPKWHDPEALANDLYTLYCEHVGGKAWNGDPLPTWEQFYGDAKKTKQASGWVAVAVRAIGRLTNRVICPTCHKSECVKPSATTDHPGCFYCASCKAQFFA